MKMQNTEMEFVTFDAQDVLTTSLFTVSYFSGSLLDGRDVAFNSWSQEYFLNSAKDAGIEKNAVTGNGYKFGEQASNYYVINSATKHSGGSGTIYSIDVMGYEGTPGGDYLETLNEVFAYLSSITQ